MIARIVTVLASSKALFVAALAAGAICGLALSFGSTTHTVVARFSNADGLVTGNEVRIAGIEVGTVQSLDIHVDAATGQQYAQATFTVDDAHWPLHQGTVVAVRPKGVLSNVFVSVEQGSSKAPSLGDSPAFAVDQTSSPVNLDELSNIFDPSVRTSIRTQLQEGVLAFGGSAVGDLNQTLVNADPLTAAAVPVTSVLGARTPELDRLTIEFDKISGDLAREDSNLRGLLTNGDTFLGVLATNQLHVQNILVHAAGTLNSLDQALSGTDVQTALAKFFSQGPHALAETKYNADNVAPLIARVDPYIGDLDTLLHEFVTATGYTQPGTNNAYGGLLDMLRVDASLPPETASACGGYPSGQAKGC